MNAKTDLRVLLEEGHADASSMTPHVAFSYSVAIKRSKARHLTQSKVHH
jgi:hypothetical protein